MVHDALDNVHAEAAGTHLVEIAAFDGRGIDLLGLVFNHDLEGFGVLTVGGAPTPAAGADDQ